MRWHCTPGNHEAVATALLLVTASQLHIQLRCAVTTLPSYP
jgi:hypothetical protein